MSSGFYVAVVATSVAGIAIGALVVIVFRPTDRPPPQPPQQGPPEVYQQHAPPQWQQPASRMQGMPMQAMSRPMNAMGGPGYGPHGQRGAPPAVMPHGAQHLVAGRPLPMAPEREADQAQRLGRQFEAEFENTVPSMEDLVRVREENEAPDLNVSPSDVLEMLSAGNVRFWTGQSSRPEINAMQRRAEIWQSYPKVAIIGCSDSRVPIEIVFDLALGDVFGIRVAGARAGRVCRNGVAVALPPLRPLPSLSIRLRSAGRGCTQSPGKTTLDDAWPGPEGDRPQLLARVPLSAAPLLVFLPGRVP